MGHIRPNAWLCEYFLYNTYTKLKLIDSDRGGGGLICRMLEKFSLQGPWQARRKPKKEIIPKRDQEKKSQKA